MIALIYYLYTTKKVANSAKKLKDTTIKEIKAHIIDGYGIAFRAFYAFPSVINKNGMEIGGLIGFIKMISNLFKKLNPSHCIVIFDVGKSFRNDIFPEYKSHRKKASPEIYAQLPFLRNVCDILDLKFDQIDGYEADDLIASYAKHFSQLVNFIIKSIVISSDKDLVQVIDENTQIFDPIKSKYMNEKNLLEEYGISPKQFIDIQSLTGDAADNIPGVRGIGNKIAHRLIKEYKSIENIFSNIENIKSKKKIYQSLLENKDVAMLSKKLVTLKNDLNTQFNINDIKIQTIIDTKAQRCMEYLFNIQSENSLGTSENSVSKSDSPLCISENSRATKTKNHNEISKKESISQQQSLFDE